MTDTPQGFAVRAKSVSTVIASVTALIVAVGGLLRKPEEPAARATYEEMGQSVKELTEAATRNHDDIVALRGYVDGVSRSAVMAAPSASSAASARPALVPVHQKAGGPPKINAPPVVHEPPSFDNLKAQRGL